MTIFDTFAVQEIDIFLTNCLFLSILTVLFTSYFCAMNYPDDIFIGGPITTIANQVVELYDPVKDETTERLLLNDQKNWTMLFFYPADFSVVCPTELHKINELIDEFRYEHTEVLVISRDSTFVHKNWVKHDPQLADFKIKMISDREGVLGKDF